MTKEQKLFHVLNDLGIPVGTKCRQYIEDCVFYALQNNDRYVSYTKEMLYRVAKINGVSISAIDKLIRKFFKLFCAENHSKTRTEIFGDVEQITSYKFIAGIAKYMKISD